MTELINTIILAAGKGTRLKIDTPKPLCICLGETLVNHVIKNLIAFEEVSNQYELKIGLVVGHEKEKVTTHINKSFSGLKFQFANQTEQLGTGHAVKIYFESYPSAWDNLYTLIVCADTPLITKEVYLKLLQHLRQHNVDAVCASFLLDNPTGYGRIEKTKTGFRIIEEKDASDKQRGIKEVNSGVYLMKTSYVKNHLANLDNQNQSQEFYLTDLLKETENISSLIFEDSQQFLGVNDLFQLDQARYYLQKKINQKHMLSGVQIINSDSVYIESSVQIEAGVVIYPNVQLTGHTKIGKNSIIESGTTIKDSIVEKNVLLKANSYLEKAHVKNSAAIGPMARLREGSVIGEECKIGNFVETKNAEFAKGVKVSHLSYVGDAIIGEHTNIGCGFITCNYDGEKKHQTIIGKNSFIGSDCQMIAPVEIGSNAYIGSGSTINKNVPDHAFAIARQRQVTRENMAKKFLKEGK